MAISLGPILGAAANLVSASSKPRSVKQFLHTFNNFGIQVQNNFEVNFSGLQDVVFFIQDLNIPGLKHNFEQIYFDGKVVDIPVNYEYEHDFTINVLNDANGYIYTTLANFIINDTTDQLADSGYTMVIKALTGDEKHFKGSVYTLNGVRFTSLGGLQYGHSLNGISTFTVGMKCIDWTVTPGGLGTIAGIAGALTKVGL